jgi:hypothetical protein
MRIESDSVIPFPRPRVYVAYRDELPGLVEFLPNVREIKVEERKESEGGILDLVNIWQAGGDIPVPVRAVLSESMLSWTDYAHWEDQGWVCNWRIETHSFREAVQCTGENKFIELGPDRTRLEIRGQIAIDLKQVRGVPNFLAGSLGRTVEHYLVKQITANLTSVSDGITRYLRAKG